MQTKIDHTIQRSRRGLRAGTKILLAMALFLATCALASAARNPSPIEMNKGWGEALKSLEGLPVQDTGFIRSATTFAQNEMIAITGKRGFSDQSALATTLWLMANPEKAAGLPLVKLDHPDLVRLYGAKRISANTYGDQKYIEKLRERVATNQSLMQPLGAVDSSCSRLESLAEDFAIVPRNGEWLSPAQLIAETNHGSGQIEPLDAAIIRGWDALESALKAGDPEAGAKAAEALADAVFAAAKGRDIALPRLGVDVTYQKVHPFMKSAFLYLFAALFYGAALLFPARRKWGEVGGFAFLSLGFAAQIFGIVCRWILAERAPLSNMYESFTFATAGMILVALVFEAMQRIRLAGFGAALLGFVFMVLAHMSPIFSSEILPLVPALQSSWLTYHVITIMLSYSAFALSFFVSICYLAKDVLGGDGPSGSRALSRLPSLATLDTFNYKIIAVGFPLLTLGIVLGAVWANTAWGRPWGFDPKETWSAITWLIYAVYLHVRFFAGWKGRLAQIVALIGFACVLFTYLGVNYLLPSLHSYVS